MASGLSKILEFTVNLVQQQIANLNEVTFAQIIINANKGKGGEIGDLTKQIEDAFGKLKKRRLIKWCIIIGVIVVLALIGKFAQ